MTYYKITVNRFGDYFLYRLRGIRLPFFTIGRWVRLDRTGDWCNWYTPKEFYTPDRAREYMEDRYGGKGRVMEL